MVSWTVACHQTPKPRPMRPCNTPQTFSGVAFMLDIRNITVLRDNGCEGHLRFSQGTKGMGDETGSIEEDGGTGDMVKRQPYRECTLARQELCVPSLSTRQKINIISLTRQTKAEQGSGAHATCQRSVQLGGLVSFSVPTSSQSTTRTLINTSAVLLSCKNGRSVGDHKPCTTTGMSRAMCNRKITELQKHYQ